MQRLQPSSLLSSLALLALAGCASAPNAAPGAELALDCDELSVAVPDVMGLSRVDLRDDVENWRQVLTRRSAGDSGTARWSTFALLAVQVRPDGSVARACVARGSDLVDLDRSWLEAMAIAQLRPGVVPGNGGWLRFRGT